MSYRIETAEVLAFRLKISRETLLGLAEYDRPALTFEVEPEGSAIVVSTESGESLLKFRSIGAEAMLTGITLANDDRGEFFHRVIGPLMVRHGGDLHIRLAWNTPERNTHGDFADVRITRGATTYPGLLTNVLSAPPPAGPEERGDAAAAPIEE